MGEMITDEEVDMMINMVDSDGDGQVRGSRWIGNRQISTCTRRERKREKEKQRVDAKRSE